MRIDPLLTTYGAAEILRVSVRKVNRLVRDGHLPHIELPGGDIRFDTDDLREFAEAHKKGAAITESPLNQ